MNYIGVGLYLKGSQKAVELYSNAFKLELGYHVLNDDGTYFHSELCRDGSTVVCVVESSEAVSGFNPVQLGFQFESIEELNRAFYLLKDGGTVKMEPCELPWSPYAAEVVDRFGVDWFISLPQHRPPDDFKPGDMQNTANSIK